MVALIFWKGSLDFQRIIKHQQDKVEPRGQASPDRKKQLYKKTADEVAEQVKNKREYEMQAYSQQQQQQ